MSSGKIKTGAVHGRFQPLHKGHVEYILEAKKNCDFLWIGITQYNISSLVNTPDDPHRQIPISNPLSYFERVHIITSSLVCEGLSQETFSCTPFPIESPEYLKNFLPASIQMYTTICDDWNIHKIQVLEEVGYSVEVLWEKQDKNYEGIEIRRMILEGDESWKAMVTDKTAELLKEYNIHQRLKYLSDLQNKS